MTQKKTTTLNQLLEYINTSIEQISTLPVNNTETQAYLHAMYDVRKTIEEYYISREIEELHNAFDNGYFNGAELIEYTSDQYLDETYFSKENNIYL